MLLEQSNQREEWQSEVREGREACLCNAFEDMGESLDFILMAIRNMRAYSFSTATVTNYHTLVLKIIHDYYLPVFEVRSLKWVC